MAITTLSSSFRVVIPKSVRQSMRYRVGQRFTIVEKGDSVVLVPVGRIEELRGLLKGAETSCARDHWEGARYNAG